MSAQKGNDKSYEPAVLAGAFSKVLTQTAIAAADLLREYAPDAYSVLEEHIQENVTPQPQASGSKTKADKRKQPATVRGKTTPKASRTRRKSNAAEKNTEHGVLLTPKEFAQRSEVKSDQTIRNRLRQGRLIGWRQGKRGYVLPGGQINRKGRTIAGLGEILEIIGDPKLAWEWTTQANSELNGQTPLTLLRRGSKKRVLSAATAYVERGDKTSKPQA